MKSPDRAPYRACICSRVLVSTDDDLALAPSHTAPMELDTHPELIEQVNAGHYATFKAVHRNPVPVIVAVHGVVLGGGIGITGAAEIVPLAARKLLFDKEGKAGGHQDVIAERDECNRASTTLDDLAALKPVWKEGKWVQQGEFITAGNASQFSDGAAAVLLMSRAQAKQRALEPLGVYRGLAVSGCAPEEMGIGPVGNQRGVCLPSGLLPRLFAHSQRALERQWRSHRHRASVWHVGHTHGGPCLVGRPSAWCAFCGGSDVHWRRHGCGRAV